MAHWYVTKDGEFVGIIARDEPNSWDMRREAQEYADCEVWVFTGHSWYSISSNAADSAIWRDGEPPESVLMAKMIGE